MSRNHLVRNLDKLGYFGYIPCTTVTGKDEHFFLNLAAEIAYKRVNDYDWVYDDTKTSADRDVSIWRPYDNEAGFCALGDVVYASHSKPTISSVTVKALKSGALSNPSSFREVGAIESHLVTNYFPKRVLVFSLKDG